MHKAILPFFFALTFAATPSLAQSTDESRQPNIVMITSDDTGFWDISRYSLGMRGFRTENIDRIFDEGLTFTDYYAEQSCTAGRSALITGQTTIRTGLAKVGLPGSATGMHPEDPTIARALKEHGYATAQFGKNHLGDLDEHLPTMHGFDEFFGMLYHLNAFQELELPDYPQDPAFRERFGPRNALRSSASPDGGQSVEDAGPITIERMRTFDDEVLTAGLDFIDRKHAAEEAFFLWMNSTRMHYPTYVPEEWDGVSSQGLYADGLLQHDAWVGGILDKLDALGIADDTIVIYNVDNGPQYNTWPDSGITPFRSEKFTNWEGAFRVPAAVRWPAHIEPGTVTNEIFSHLDWFPSLLAAAGDPNIKDRLLAGDTLDGKPYRVHLDGFNQLPLLTGETETGARRGFFYFTDNGELSAIRFGDWKLVFLEQRGKALGAWQEPMVTLNFPKLFNLRRDPFERADHNSNEYQKWAFDRTFVGPAAQAIATEFFHSLRDFPPRQKPDSFNMEAVLRTIESSNN